MSLTTKINTKLHYVNVQNAYQNDWSLRVVVAVVISIRSDMFTYLVVPFLTAWKIMRFWCVCFFILRSCITLRNLQVHLHQFMPSCCTVFGRPFVKRFALCYRTIVCPVCPVCLSCPVWNVRTLWPNGWTDQDETWHAGRPLPWPDCFRWGHSSRPQKRVTAPNFQPMSVVAKWLHGLRCHLVGR